MGQSDHDLVTAVRMALERTMESADGVSPPAAVLWPDPKRQWESLMPAMKTEMTDLYSLGDYAPDDREGPVIWLKCIVDRSLPGDSPDRDSIPVLYLPGVGGDALRNAADCKAEWRPLVELQFRGTVWRHANGRDWTVAAFLKAQALDVARDHATGLSLLRALPYLALESISSLRGRRLEAEDFDKLSVPDSIRDLLLWMSDSEAYEYVNHGARWTTFCDISRRQYGVDPVEEGTTAAAEKLSGGDKAWNPVWSRFCEAPKRYPGLPALLSAIQSEGIFGFHNERLPACNEAEEANLEKALRAAVNLPHADACERVDKLNQQHRDRRDWVWAQLGLSPYAVLLEPLGRLARKAKKTLGGAAIDSVVDDYVSGSWECDRAALEALAAERVDSGLLGNVVQALYEPWLDKSARHFQAQIRDQDLANGKLVAPVDAEPETCILFVDGLRFDLGMMLKERLDKSGYDVTRSFRMAPFPTVTATSKPVASPAHGDCRGPAIPEQFVPAVESNGKPADYGRLHKLLQARGLNVLGSSIPLLREDNGAGAWMECGEIDSRGHKLEADLVHEVEKQLTNIHTTITALLDSGWRHVRVVTDHGWLLLPNGLPKVDVPASVVESKWARCAAVKGASTPDVPTRPWYWDPRVQVATPPGIGAFRAGMKYAHGGLSPQECITPDLRVTGRESPPVARIKNIDWRGMRCRVQVDASTSGFVVDLRLNRHRANSSITTRKALDARGKASLVVRDDSDEGAAAIVVVLSQSGQVLSHQATTVGGDDA